MQIKEINERADIVATFNLLKQLYEGLEQETYVKNVTAMLQQNYKIAAIFDNSNAQSQSCIGFIGIRFNNKINSGITLEIEDFALNFTTNSQLVAKMLMDFVDKQAKILNCSNVIINLATKQIELHKIIAAAGFSLDGFLFKKILNN